MTSIAYCQSDVVASNKIDRLLDVRRVRGIDSVRYVIAQRTRSVTREERIAAVVREVWGHDRRGRFEMRLGKEPGGLNLGALLRVVSAEGIIIAYAGKRSRRNELSTEAVVESSPL